MKIALVHAFSWPEVRRGGERLVDDLATYLRGSGHKVDVYSGTTGESQFRLSPQGRNYRLRIPYTRALEGYGLGPIETFGARALTPLLMHRYDVVHAFTPTAALVSLLTGQPTVYTVIGHPTVRSLPTRRIARRLLTLAVERSTRVAALSRSARDEIELAFGRRPEVLPPGIFLDRFPPKTQRRSGPGRILFSGDTSNRDKGLTILLGAFVRVLDRQPDTRLILSGPGDPYVALEELGPARDRVTRSIDLLGQGDVEDVPGRYRSADVTVLPSRNEAFGIVFVESLASGTPVIGGTPGGATDIIDSPDIGRLVDYGDVEGLASAIEECLALAKEHPAIERCRASAEKWAWGSIGPRYESLYASLEKDHRAPGAEILRAMRPRKAEQAQRSAERPSLR